LTDRPSDLEAKVAELTDALRRVEQRVAALERARPATVRRVVAAPQAEVEEAAGGPSELGDVTRWLSLAGRTLLVLAGAFVLRALTDSGKVPAWLGVGMGFAYAGIWIAMADRAGTRGQSSSAGFHGLAAVMIGFPLLFEATSKFRLLPAPVATAVLAAFTAVALGVAARRRLQALAWLVSLGGIPTALALMAVGGRLAPPALYLVLLGVATLWLGYVRDWVFVRWPVALVTDLVVVFMALRVVRPGSIEGPGSAFLVQFALMALYLGSIAARTLLLQRDVVVFELVQTAAAILVGLGGASWVASSSGMGAGGFGAASLALGLATYAVAFAFVERRQKGRANFYFYSSVAIVFVLAGTGLVLPARALPLVWAALAVASCAVARRQGRRTLGAHGAIYAVAAAIAGDLLGHALETTVGSPLVPWTPAPFGSLLVIAALGATAWLRGGTARATTLERGLQVALLGTLAIASAGVAIGWLVPIFAGAPGPEAGLGAVATVRTAVLVVGVLLLAWLGRFDAWREAGWLAYPALAATGLKVLVEDLPRSRPATLFLTLALCGAALILVPRLRARRARPPGEEAPDRASRDERAAR